MPVQSHPLLEVACTVTSAYWYLIANKLRYRLPSLLTPLAPTPSIHLRKAPVHKLKPLKIDTKFTFELCQATEKSLIDQIVDEVDATYLAALRNVNTSRYGESILSLTQHLYYTYWRINPQQVKSRELELYNMPFDLSLPVDTIFNAVDDLMELSDQADIPMSADQSVNLVYVIFARQPVLLQDLCAWHKKPVDEKLGPTWRSTSERHRMTSDHYLSLALCFQTRNKQIPPPLPTW